MFAVDIFAFEILAKVVTVSWVMLAPVKTLMEAIFAYPPDMMFMYDAFVVTLNIFVTLIEFDM